MINDIMPIEMAVDLPSLTGMEFLLHVVILGKQSEVLCEKHRHMDAAIAEICKLCFLLL
jgi:hypothetical protein